MRMSEARCENRTFREIFLKALELGKRKGVISEKSLERELKITYPTAVKTLCAFEFLGALGEEGKKGFAFEISPQAEKRILETEHNNSEYNMLAEPDRYFKGIGRGGYMRETLLPAIWLGLQYHSLSVRFIQRKMNVVAERANELMDIISAMGLLGEGDEFNSDRRTLLLDSAAYDETYMRIEARKW